MIISCIFVCMRKHIQIFISLTIATLIFVNCSGEKTDELAPVYNFSAHEVSKDVLTPLLKGSTYLSVYSEIYSNTEKRTHALTVTVSIRNISSDKSIYLSKADYFNTHGELLTSYLKNPIEVLPLETIEIVIDKSQTHGGTGGNFIFDWSKDSTTASPIFESVMISTSGQQGISFTSQGVEIE